MMHEVERGQGEGVAGNDSVVRERWVRNMTSFCQDARLLVAADEVSLQGGDVEGLRETENEKMAEALAACVLLWGGLEAEATPTAVAIEYGRLRSALEGLSAREVVGVSGVLGFRIEGEQAGGAGALAAEMEEVAEGGVASAEAGGGSEAGRLRRVSDDDLLGADGECFGEALRDQIAIALVSPCEEAWVLRRQHIAPPRAHLRVQTDGDREGRREREYASKRNPARLHADAQGGDAPLRERQPASGKEQERARKRQRLAMNERAAGGDGQTSAGGSVVAGAGKRSFSAETMQMFHKYGKKITVKNQVRHQCSHPDCAGRSVFFSESSRLKRHMLKHSGEKNFTCPEPGCGKAFSLHYNLVLHIKHMHSGEQRSQRAAGASKKKRVSLHPARLVLAKGTPHAEGACVKASRVRDQPKVEEDLFRPMLRYSAKGTLTEMMPVYGADRETASGKGLLTDDRSIELYGLLKFSVEGRSAAGQQWECDRAERQQKLFWQERRREREHLQQYHKNVAKLDLSDPLGIANHLLFLAKIGDADTRQKVRAAFEKVAHGLGNPVGLSQGLLLDYVNTRYNVPQRKGPQAMYRAPERVELGKQFVSEIFREDAHSEVQRLELDHGLLPALRFLWTNGPVSTPCILGPDTVSAPQPQSQAGGSAGAAAWGAGVSAGGFPGAGWVHSDVVARPRANGGTAPAASNGTHAHALRNDGGPHGGPSAGASGGAREEGGGSRDVQYTHMHLWKGVPVFTPVPVRARSAERAGQGAARSEGALDDGGDGSLPSVSSSVLSGRGGGGGESGGGGASARREVALEKSSEASNPFFPYNEQYHNGDAARASWPAATASRAASSTTMARNLASAQGSREEGARGAGGLEAVPPSVGWSDGWRHPFGATGGWTEWITIEGHRYYHHAVRKITQWEMPPEFRASSAAPPAPRPVSDGGLLGYTHLSGNHVKGVAGGGSGAGRGASGGNGGGKGKAGGGGAPICMRKCKACGTPREARSHCAPCRSMSSLCMLGRLCVLVLCGVLCACDAHVCCSSLPSVPEPNPFRM